MEKLIPISYEEIDEYDETYTYDVVEFLSNFGTFFKGEKYKRIDVNYIIGYINAFGGFDKNMERIVIKTQRFELTPIFDEAVKVPKTTMSCL